MGSRYRNSTCIVAYCSIFTTAIGRFYCGTTHIDSETSELSDLRGFGHVLEIQSIKV